MVMTIQDRALQATRDRAIAIYQWALSNPDSFAAKQVPEHAKNKQEQRAYEMLTSRGLLKRVGLNKNLPHWRLARVCEPSKCLEITAVIDPAFRGMISYRVPPSVAQGAGASPDLKQYAIGEVKRW